MFDTLEGGLQRLGALALEAEDLAASNPGHLAVLERLLADPAWARVVTSPAVHKAAGDGDHPSSLRTQGRGVKELRAEIETGAGNEAALERYRTLADLSEALTRLVWAAQARLRDDNRRLQRFPSDLSSGLTRWQERRAKEFLAGKVGEVVAIAQVAEQCGLSRSHFIKAFKKATGDTPHRWLVRLRVARAKELLRGGLPIAEIAQECGFTDQSHLTRVFRTRAGIPPGAWRRQISR